MTVSSHELLYLPIPTCIIQGGTIVLANPSFTRLSGYESEKISGRPWREIIQPEDGDEPAGRARLVVKDTGYLDVQTFAAPLDYRGEPARVVQLVDVSELIRTRREAARVVSRLENVLQNTNDVVQSHTLDDGRFLYLSPAFTRLFGHRIKDWLGRPIRQLLAPRFRGQVDQYLQDIVQKGDYQGIMCILDAGGRERYIEFYNVIDKDEDLGLVVQGIGHEVTERITRRKKMETMFDGITQAMADMVEQKDPYTSGHQRRVAEIAVTIAQEMGFPAKRLRPLFIAASLHDIGKISIPSEILSKPTALTHLERQLIQQHPRVGADILRRVPFPWDVAGMILRHHERLDGSGYPLGLSAEQIDEESRILAVADVYEAMTTHRPYRPALSTQTAIEELSQKSDVLYDRNVVRTLVNMID